jgi:sugar O-acyltransferase (sialic acid O-acetyltransferase NeuD family)
MKKLAIIGASTNARVIYKFITHYNFFDVTCFAVDKEYKSGDHFLGLPLILIEELPNFINKDQDLVFIGVQWNRLNSDRRYLYEKIKAQGYNFARILSPTAIIHEDVMLGDNIWIADNVVVETNCNIGSNSFIKTSAIVAESTIIKDHCFIGANSTIGGGCIINEQCFVGLAATVFEQVNIGRKCLIGARTIIKRNLPDYTLVKTNTNNQVIKYYDSISIEEQLIAKSNVR